MLLQMTERNGCLVVEGDETRWEEAAARFVWTMMQWSGQVGLRWREEAAKVAE